MRFAASPSTFDIKDARLDTLVDIQATLKQTMLSSK
jgi:hypothetical protein